MSVFDVQAVKARVAKETGEDESRQIFLGEIMDWSDYFMENLQGKSDSPEAREALASITNLWIAYAQFEISLKKWKKAVDVYESAISDPVVKCSVDLYKSYASFCQGRGKLGNAQNAYIKGICSGVLKQHETDDLWVEMHKMLQSSGLEEYKHMPLEKLYDAVKGELEAKGAAGSLASLSPSLVSNIGGDKVSESRMGIAESKDDDILQKNVPVVQPPPSSSHPSTSNTNTNINSNNDEWDSVAGLTPEVLRRVHSKRPPLLFSAPDKDPMILGLDALTPQERRELEIFLGTTLVALINYEDSSRIFSSKGLGGGGGGGGGDFGRGPTAGGESDPSFAVAVLNLLEGFWTAQALKERHFNEWFSDLRQWQSNDEQAVIQACNERMKQRDPNAAALNQADKARLTAKNTSRSEILHAVVNKTLYSIVMDQLRALVSIGFPSVSPIICERLELYCTQGKDESAVLQEFHKLQRMICALVSIRLKAIEKYVAYTLSCGRDTGYMQQQQQQLQPHRQQQPYPTHHHAHQPPYMGAQSTYAVPPPVPNPNHVLNYYSQEEKLKRKRRKMLEKNGAEDASSGVVEAGGGSVDGVDSILNSLAQAIPPTHQP